MANTTRRYKSVGLNNTNLQKRVPGSPTFSAIGANIYVDLTIDSAYTTELDNAMTLLGWTYVSADTSPTPMTNAITDMIYSPFTEKTLPVTNDIVLIEDSAASYAKKKVKLNNFRGSPFGQFVQTTSRSTGASVTGTTWTNFLTLTTSAATEAGLYRIDCWFTWAMSSNLYAHEARLQYDNTTNLSNNVTWLRESMTGDTIVTYPSWSTSTLTMTAGTHTFDFDFRSSHASGTAYITTLDSSQACRMILWKLTD